MNGTISEKLDLFFHLLDDVCVRIGRDAETISTVLATKYVNSLEMVDLLNTIKRHPKRSICIGENRIQDAVKKFDAIKTHQPNILSSTRKILIGTLQKNKVNKAIDMFDEIHSVDSKELAVCIDDRLCLIGKKMPIFLQINVSGEVLKHGIPFIEADEVIKEVKTLTHFHLEGLMTMAPFTSDQDSIRSVFRSLRQLADHHCVKTSMGMSNDWKIAIEEGSDILRIGSAIFI